MTKDSRTGISAEANLLKLLVREDYSDHQQETGDLLKGPFSWPKFIEMADDNGVFGLIAAGISSLHRQKLVPDGAAISIQAQSLGVAAASMRIQVELERLIGIAAANDVPLIVLKGAAVGNLLYPTPHSRQAGDIDLLCKESDFTRLHDAMVAAGYTTNESRELPSKCSSLETAFEQHFRTADQGLLIELHVDSIKLGVKPSNSASIWDRAIPVQIGREQVLSLSPRDLALMLAVHLHRHGFSRLAWFKDIDLLVRQYGHEINWDDVAEDARSEGAGSSLWLTYGLLTEMLGTELPAGFPDQLKPSVLSRAVWHVIWPRKKVLALQGVTRRRSVQFSIGESWRGTLPSLVLMGRRREKIGILLARIRHPFRKRQHAPN